MSTMNRWFYFSSYKYRNIFPHSSANILSSVLFLFYFITVIVIDVVTTVDGGDVGYMERRCLNNIFVGTTSYNHPTKKPGRVQLCIMNVIINLRSFLNEYKVVVWPQYRANTINTDDSALYLENLTRGTRLTGKPLCKTRKSLRNSRKLWILNHLSEAVPGWYIISIYSSTNVTVVS